MDLTDPARIYLWTGLVWRACMRGFWVVFIIRTTVQLELPALQLVLLGTVLETTVFLAEIPTGVVADMYSRKWSVVISFVLTGPAFIVAGLVTGFGPLAATQVLFGIAWTFQSGAETAWITDQLGSPEAVEPLLLRRARLQHVAGVLGMGGGAALAALTSKSSVIVSFGIATAAWGLFLAVAMQESVFDKHKGETFRHFAHTIRSGAKVIWRVPPLKVLAAVMLLLGLASEAVDRLDIRRLDQIGLSEGHNAIVLVGIIASAEAILAGLLLWAVEGRVRGRAIVRGVTLLVVGATVAVGVLSSVSVLVIAAGALIIQAGLRQAAEPMLTAWANAHAPDSARATVHSFVGQAEAAGELLGGITLGAVAATTSVSTALVCSAVLFGLAAAVSTRGGATWKPS